jgi:hypothetical protein
MSSLIFYTTERDIIVAMDTLAVSGDDFLPLLFTTKFYTVPHLGGVICGTGFGSFVCDWFVRVNTGMVVRDIPHLDHHTPSGLRELAAAPKYQELSTAGSSTIYQLGFPANDGPPSVFAYRSERNYVSESIPLGGIAIKPEGEIPDAFQFPRDFEKMMLSQRAIQSTKPREQRVHIGGDIFVCHITRNLTSIYRAASFDDRDEALRIMFRQIEDERNRG